MNGLLDRNQPRVLMVHPGALGDVLLARLAVQALRRRFPHDAITFLGGRAAGTLLHECGEVHRVFPAESAYLSELLAGIEHVSPPFREWLEPTHTAVGWFTDSDDAAAGTLRAIGVQSIQFNSALSPHYHAEHQADRYCEAIGLPVSHPALCQFLTVPLRTREEGRRVLEMLLVAKDKPLVVIHPGSGSTRKCIESWRLAQVIEWLLESGAAPLLLEGPADQVSVASMVSRLTTVLPVVRGESVTVVAGILSQAALYIGQDSGITHLAAAIGIPTIACFGPTSPHRWAPRGSNVTVLTGLDCACPTWREINHCEQRPCLQISPESMIKAAMASMVRPLMPRPEHA